MPSVPPHDATPAEGPHNQPPKRPVWPEMLKGGAPAADISSREQDLERRELAIAEQAAALERDRQNQREAEQQFARWRQTHESKVAAVQAELGDRLNRCEELIADLEREQQTIDADRGTLRIREESLRESIREELAHDFEKLNSERAGLQAEKQEFRKRLEASERELSTTSDGLRASWESERESLRKQLTAKLAAELAEERRVFDAERSQWEAEREQELAALEEERAKHEELLARAESGLEGIRQVQEQEFQERRRELEAEIASRVESLQARLAEQQASWESSRGKAEAELELLREEIETRRADQDESLAAARAEFEQFREAQLRRLDEEAHTRITAFEEERAAWLAERDAGQAQLEADAAAIEELQQTFDEQCAERQAAFDAELDERRTEAERELAEKQEMFEKECESIRRALDEERAVMENRLHFQSDHLDRTRDDLEEARREIDLRVQQARARAAGLAEMGRLRRQQLDRYRELLEQKEQSLERERIFLAEMHEQIESARAVDSERRQREAETALGDQDRGDLGEKELREDLVGRAKQLAERQARLDTLRVEIESTHRENLELRVALDEAWARLTHAVGPELAQGELLVSREFVADYFQRKDNALEQRRTLLTTELATARTQIEQLDARRKELTDWLSTNLANLHRREEELHRWANTLAARDARARDFTNRWREERLEAEQLIRGLLEQLAEATNDAPRLTVDRSIGPPEPAPEPRRAAG